MAWSEESCCFCRRPAPVREWAARGGWLEVECRTCGAYRVERRFWAAAHFKRARQPVLYRRLAQKVLASRDRLQPIEIPYEDWETIAASGAGTEA